MCDSTSRCWVHGNRIRNNCAILNATRLVTLDHFRGQAKHNNIWRDSRSIKESGDGGDNPIKLGRDFKYKVYKKAKYI